MTSSETLRTGFLSTTGETAIFELVSVAEQVLV